MPVSLRKPPQRLLTASARAHPFLLMNVPAPIPPPPADGFFPPGQRAHVLEHMNADHADAVLRYARYYAGHPEATAAQLTDIDAGGIQLLVTTAAGAFPARIAFETPLAKPDDAHLTLVAMAKDARRREVLAQARETAVWFRREFKTVLLGTVSSEGEPEASVAPAVIGEDGAFYIYVSMLAAHTRNLLQTPRASILLIEDEAVSVQMLARRRLTFPCVASPIARDDEVFARLMVPLKEKFGEVMEHLETMTDFHLIRLMPGRGRLVTGFGQAYDVDPLDWTQVVPVGGGGHRPSADKKV